MIPERKPDFRQEPVVPPASMQSGSSGRSVKVLVYHRIVPTRKEAAAHWSCVAVQDFEAHLDLLDRWGYTAVTFDDFRLSRAGKLDLPRKPVILTFDDGYRDTYELAFPLLQEFGMKAVVFVLGDRKIKTNFWDRSLGIPEAHLMDGNHILEMYESGMEIGSHSLTHTKLTELRQDHAWEEISRSRILLEILINGPVRSFSYPYGLVNEAVKRMARHAGYSTACSVGSGPLLVDQDHFEMRRIAVPNNTGRLGIGLRISTPFHYLAWAKWKFGSIFRGEPANPAAGNSNGSPWVEETAPEDHSSPHEKLGTHHHARGA